MVSEGALKLAGADEPASRTFLKVIGAGAAAGTFESPCVAGWAFLSKAAKEILVIMI